MILQKVFDSPKRTTLPQQNGGYLTYSRTCALYITPSGRGTWVSFAMQEAAKRDKKNALVKTAKAQGLGRIRMLHAAYGINAGKVFQVIGETRSGAEYKVHETSKCVHKGGEGTAWEWCTATSATQAAAVVGPEHRPSRCRSSQSSNVWDNVTVYRHSHYGESLDSQLRDLAQLPIDLDAVMATCTSLQSTSLGEVVLPNRRANRESP